MAHVDTPILERVLRECPEVQRAAFENVIFRINVAYSSAKLKCDKVDFEEIRNDVLQYCDLWDLFTHQDYKSAVGKYYAWRRALSIREGYEPGTVYEASAHHVWLAATTDVKILFKSLAGSGVLEFEQVDNGACRFHRLGGSTHINKERYQRAKRQALAIMNSRRKY